jgi:hypothetical protein
VSEALPITARAMGGASATQTYVLLFEERTKNFDFKAPAP